MKKKKRILIIIISIILTITVFATVDYFLVKNDKKPIFSGSMPPTWDGGHVTYVGLGYVIVKCNSYISPIGAPIKDWNDTHIGFYNLDSTVCY